MIGIKMGLDHDRDVMSRLRGFLATGQFGLNGRLPPERALCLRLGISRSTLRKAMAVLEAEGQIWRHVGRGTFVGARPLGAADGVAAISARTNPAEVMEARLLLEPELARLAALNATPADLAEMTHCIRQTQQARDWRVYETWDGKLHRAIAQATGSSLLLALFDILNGVRRTVAWGRLRVYQLTPDLDHHSFTEHDAILRAIAERDLELAATAMRAHLDAVRANLLGRAAAGPRRGTG